MLWGGHLKELHYKEFGRKVHVLILNNIKEKAYGIGSDIKKIACAGEWLVTKCH